MCLFCVYNSWKFRCELGRWFTCIYESVLRKPTFFCSVGLIWDAGRCMQCILHASVSVLKCVPADLHMHAVFGFFLHVVVALLLQRTRLHLPERTHTVFRTVYLCWFWTSHTQNTVSNLIHSRLLIPARLLSISVSRKFNPDAFTEAYRVVVQKHRKPSIIFIYLKFCSRPQYDYPLLHHCPITLFLKGEFV